MKTVNYAFFAPDGRHLIAITSGRFHCYTVDTTTTEPTVEKIWDHKLSQVLWIAFGRDVVIASNTSDKHVAVSKKTGEVVWERPRPKQDGITGRGIVLDHGGNECYVFTGYESVFQVSTATGQDACTPWPIELWTANLHDLGNDQLGVVVRAYVGANRDHYSMAVLDLNAQSFTFRCDFPPQLHQPLPAPDGSRCMLVRMDPTADPTVEIFGVPSALSECSYAVDRGQLRQRAAWSPSGEWIGAGTAGGYLLLDSSLERVVEVPYGRTFGTPTFHPDGKHVLLPRDKTTSIESIDALFDEYAQLD